MARPIHRLAKAEISPDTTALPIMCAVLPVIVSVKGKVTGRSTPWSVSRPAAT